ncbi:MAG TPA: 3-deoxy-manno-octulosonate cytidylyltransferase [Novosphingobium sp.]|nr:3-deoxy-manno-octulosonate cytidylyltransferase [Novosphingobium sp.]
MALLRDTEAWPLGKASVPGGACAVVIPARYGSTRYPGKPLALLRGGSGEARPLIRRSWEAARAGLAEMGMPARLLVATDDPRIAEAVAAFGGEAVLTPPDCRNGTERCAALLEALPASVEVVVNWQGDAPLMPPAALAAVVAGLGRDAGAVMATAALACSAQVHAHLLADAAAGRVGGTTVVVNGRGRALYFSKRVLPFAPAAGHAAVRLHLGLYAYRRAALAAYAALPPSRLEQEEGLEQLRFFEGEGGIAVVDLAEPGWPVIELNNPEDAPLIEAVLAQRGIA